MRIGAPETGKTGYIGKTGAFVINPQFDGGGLFGGFLESFAVVQNSKLWGYIDKTGKFVIAPLFVWALDFRDGLARVQTGSSRWHWKQNGIAQKQPTIAHGST